MNQKDEAAVTLLELLQSTSDSARINTVERALEGSGVGQKNFNATWAGYKLNNRPTATINGRDYNINGTGYSGLPIGRKISARAGKGSIYAHWK